MQNAKLIALFAMIVSVNACTLGGKTMPFDSISEGIPGPPGPAGPGTFTEETSIVSVRDYGATGDGVTGDRNAIYNAIAAANNRELLFPAGTYRVESDLIFGSAVAVRFLNGAKLVIDSGVTVTINGPLEAGLYQIFSGDGSVNIGKVSVPMVYPQWCGVVGDGTTDDTTALTNAVNTAISSDNTLYIPQGLEIRITDTVDMKGLRSVRSEGKIIVDFDNGIGIRAGYDSRSGRPSKIHFACIYRGANSTSNILLRLVGLKNAVVDIQLCPYVQLYADSSDETISSIACSTFHWGTINKLELYGDSGTSWINENLHIGGRFDTILIDSVSYPHNDNVFLKPCIELGSIQVMKGINNTFYDIRSEGDTQITFGSDTYHNIVIDRYQSDSNAVEGRSVVTDNGWENYVIGSIENLLIRENLVVVDRNTGLFDSTGELPSLSNATPGLEKLYAESWAYVLDITIPVSDIRRFYFHSDTIAWRPQVTCYDSGMNVLDGTDPWYISNNGGWYAFEGYYSFYTDVQNARIIFNNPSVAYARIRIMAGTYGAIFGYFAIDAYYDKTKDGSRILKTIGKNIRRPLYQVNIPTQGIGNIGDIITSDDGILQCMSRTDTSLTANAPSGATSVIVESVTGMSLGDLIGIHQDNGQTHWTSISGIDAETNSVNLVSALSSDASSNNPVATNRWIQW